jgi:hypothetical protein
MSRIEQFVSVSALIVLERFSNTSADPSIDPRYRRPTVTRRPGALPVTRTMPDSSTYTELATMPSTSRHAPARNACGEQRALSAGGSGVSGEEAFEARGVSISNVHGTAGEAPVATPTPHPSFPGCLPHASFFASSGSDRTRRESQRVVATPTRPFATIRASPAALHWGPSYPFRRARLRAPTIERGVRLHGAGPGVVGVAIRPPAGLLPHWEVRPPVAKILDDHRQD